MRFPLLAAIVLVLSISGCPGPSEPADGGTDGGGDRIDAPLDAATDGGASDGGTDGGASDGGADGGASDGGVTDTPGAIDGGPDVPGALCPDGLGYFCESTGECPSGYECNVGRCAPQGRPLCGGFAGAMCTGAAFPSCLYFATADFGPCLTPAEVDCICDDPRRAPGFVCP